MKSWLYYIPGLSSHLDFFLSFVWVYCCICVYLRVFVCICVLYSARISAGQCIKIDGDRQRTDSTTWVVFVFGFFVFLETCRHI